MRLLPWNTATRRPPERRRCKLRTTGTAPIPVDGQSIRDGGPATVVAGGTARDVRKPVRGKECETAVMSGRTYNDGQNGFRAVGSCEQEPAERRRPGMRRGPWRLGGKRRDRNQKAVPLEEAFAALLDKGRAAPERGLKSPLDRNLLRPSPVIIRSSTCAPWGVPLSRRTRLTPGAKRR